jgi:hypothetical protein
MPRTVVSLRSRMPDHSIGVPAPENTVRFGIPNACTECHQNAAWAVARLTEWYRTDAVKNSSRGRGLHRGERRDPAVTALVDRA